MTTTTDGNPATDYARKGWSVFPCYGIEKEACACAKPECAHPGKHPRTKNGLKDATTDEVQIQKWWPAGSSRSPNIAIATGAASKLVVIDVDPRHGGHETLSALEADLGPLPRDWTVKTGGGGLHIYMAYPESGTVRSRNGWRPGVDVKADGGYVIAPPSLHVSGSIYEWQSRVGDVPPATPSNWLAALCSARRRKCTNRQTDAGGHASLLQRAQKYAASVPGAGAGERNDAAFRLAGHMASFLTKDGARLGQEQICSVMEGWNLRCIPPLEVAELQSCVASALANGSPRADKEVSDASDADWKKVGSAGDDPPTRRASQATFLVEMSAGVDLFHGNDGEAYARYAVGEDDRFHWQVARVRSRDFKRWLARQCYLVHKKAPSSQAFQDALGVIEAKALYGGQERDVAVRVAQVGGRIYVDLCNTQWQVVEIDCGGWRILDESPVMFRRAKGMIALPMPHRNGKIGDLRGFINVTDDDWPLVLGWLVATMRPSGPYPVLAVYGEHGSGKSGVCRRLRSLVDPNQAPLRADYREPRDIMIGANNGWIVALDNLSRIPDWQSDVFCRLATGGGFSCRMLYENDEETIFNAQRPLMLNCIEEVITRSDLLDRALVINLPRIEESKRRTEKDLDWAFECARPGILGGLFAAVAAALQKEDSVQLARLPRMADFAVWATAAERALGLKGGQFLAAYGSNRSSSNETALEAAPVGKVLLEFVRSVGQWSGTATELLSQLEFFASDGVKQAKSWPGSARTLGGAVKRIAPNLREAGIEVEFSKDGKKRTRLIELKSTTDNAGNSSSALSAPSAPQETSGIHIVSADHEADVRPRAADVRTFPSSAEVTRYPQEFAAADMADEADVETRLLSYAGEV